MFKAYIVGRDELPSDVDQAALNSSEGNDYFVVQAGGKSIYCQAVSELPKGHALTGELMELAYFLGVTEGVQYEQNFMGGRKLTDLPGIK